MNKFVNLSVRFYFLLGSILLKFGQYLVMTISFHLFNSSLNSKRIRLSCILVCMTMATPMYSEQLTVIFPPPKNAVTSLQVQHDSHLLLS